VSDETYFRLRGWIPMPLYALALAGFDATRLHAGEAAFGLALVCGGLALRAWARVHVGRSSDTRRLHARRLVRSGPYARTRNPLYLGNFAIATGLALLVGLGLWTLPFAAVLFLHYRRVVLAEEAMLARCFGAEYSAFRASVPRWWRVARPSVPERARLALRREWRVVALALGVAAASLAFRL
jgi:protein-S-isoprenylcysteine O-methyltransferase Ste14